MYGYYAQVNFPFNHKKEAQGKEEEVLFLKTLKNDIENKKNKKASDFTVWAELAEKWESKGNYKWAYLCYVRAIRKNKENKELHRAKALCCLKLGKTYKYLSIMMKKVLISPISEDFIQDVLQTANLFKESKKPEEACKILEIAFNDLKNGKIAFQLFKTLEESQQFGKIIEIYSSHFQLMKICELSAELEILHLIAILHAPSIYEKYKKDIEKITQNIIKKIDPIRLNLGAKLAEELWKNEKIELAEQLYKKLSEFNNAPIFPQFIMMLKEQGKYNDCIKYIKIWKNYTDNSDRAQIWKYETEISSILMHSGELQEDEKISTGKRKKSKEFKNETKLKRIKIEQDNIEKEDKKEEIVKRPIQIMEKLLEEWNSQKIKGKHDLNTVSELCKIIDNVLSNNSLAFVFFQCSMKK